MFTPLLLSCFYLVRRAALALVAVGSIVSGGALLWLWFNPERIAGVRTLSLLALLGLFVLPAVAFVLTQQDRRRRRDAAVAHECDQADDAADRFARFDAPRDEPGPRRAVA
ncbi:MAG: hypothetical protein ACF8QF_12700 [Phycisphaerales bacterium]